ncbi:MAG: Re/Si-specific NAD(P)(+) transhydrogenase subunit alpha [Nitrospirae bacterium]|nr:MAG: Re/Si-specific NAD(P)(+) transhydrogenase subunit alpha [Nitrospirota bacterium]
MKVAVPKETAANERRVALIPAELGKLAKLGIEVAVEAGAGAGAFHTDEAYREAGAEVVEDKGALLAGADCLLKVQPPTAEELEALPEGAATISLFQPLESRELLDRCRARRISAFALEYIPRTTLAQAMDVLSSQATVAGYKAVLMAADRLPKFYPMLMTAAGMIQPATVLVIGAGVAGLQAIATARRLGGVVEVSDVRKAAKEEALSLGATFLEVDEEVDAATEGGYAKEVSEEFKRKQQALLAEHAKNADVIVSTALVFGRPAPKIVTEEMVRGMRPGSVIVDLAAERGGNCELTVPGEEVERHGVRILGYTDLPSRMAVHASQMWSRNMLNFLRHLTADGAFKFDLEDEITRGCLITRDGEIVHEQVRAQVEQGG